MGLHYSQFYCLVRSFIALITSTWWRAGDVILDNYIDVLEGTGWFTCCPPSRTGTGHSPYRISVIAWMLLANMPGHHLLPPLPPCQSYWFKSYKACQTPTSYKWVSASCPNPIDHSFASNNDSDTVQVEANTRPEMSKKKVLFL